MLKLLIVWLVIILGGVALSLLWEFLGSWNSPTFKNIHRRKVEVVLFAICILCFYWGCLYAWLAYQQHGAGVELMGSDYDSETQGAAAGSLLETVSESEYKNDHYTMSAIWFISSGLLLWYGCKDWRKKSKEEME